MGENILSELTKGLEKLAKKYDWLSVEYEYRERRGVYLVSYNVPKEHDSIEFARDAMAFEDKMNDLFDDEAPLFCDNKGLFSLSQDAATIPSSTTKYHVVK